MANCPRGELSDICLLHKAYTRRLAEEQGGEGGGVAGNALTDKNALSACSILKGFLEGY